MNTLFELDLHDYNSDAEVSKRTSVRAVIENNGRFLLAYSSKTDSLCSPAGE